MNEKPRKMVWPTRPGMKLCHPVGGVLPDEGKRWPDDTFTFRRIKDGGITDVAPPAAEPAAESAPPAAA